MKQPSSQVEWDGWSHAKRESEKSPCSWSIKPQQRNGGTRAQRGWPQCEGSKRSKHFDRSIWMPAKTSPVALSRARWWVMSSALRPGTPPTTAERRTFLCQSGRTEASRGPRKVSDGQHSNEPFGQGAKTVSRTASLAVPKILGMSQCDASRGRTGSGRPGLEGPGVPERTSQRSGERRMP